MHRRRYKPAAFVSLPRSALTQPPQNLIVGRIIERHPKKTQNDHFQIFCSAGIVPRYRNSYRNRILVGVFLRVLFLFICWIIIFPSIAWIIWENLTLRSPGAIQGAIEWQLVATMANIHMFSHQDELHWPQFGELRSFRAILKYEPTQINRSNFTIQALS